MEDNPDGTADEMFLWSLGVGEALPDWIKDLRGRERDAGLNQLPRKSPPPPSRSGIGPQSCWAADSAPQGLQSIREDNETRIPSDQSRYSRFSTQGPQQPLVQPRPQLESLPQAPSAVQRMPHEPQFRHERAQSELTLKQVPQFQKDLEPSGYGSTYSHSSVLVPSVGQLHEARPSVGENGRHARHTALNAKAAKDTEASLERGRGIKEWLYNLDEAGFLVQYHESICSRVDSVDEVVVVYFKAGKLQRFFDDVGVRKLGHKRIFEKWFKENS